MKTIFAIIALLAACLHLSAQDADSTSLRPTFGADFSSEVQTDFERVRNANLLQLRAHVPLSRKLTFEAGALGSLVTGQELDVIDLQGISNIDTDELNIPFALTVADSRGSLTTTIPSSPASAAPTKTTSAARPSASSPPAPAASSPPSA